MAHVIIVGAGIYGSTTALALRDADTDVTVLDARVPGHPWSASGDWTRVLRIEYGSDSLLVEMAARARERWLTLEARLGSTFYHETGILILAPDDRGWERESFEALVGAGYGAQALDAAEVRRRWPVFGTEGVGFATFNPMGGFLAARRATEQIALAAAAAGAKFVHGETVTSVELSRGRATGVRLGSGASITADAIVLTPGAWASSLLPSVGAPSPRSTRQTVTYVNAPLDGYGAGSLPSFGEVAQGVSGHPAWTNHGLKLTVLDPGPSMDPSDADQRAIRAEDMVPYREYLARRFPGLADAALSESHVCCFTMTHDGEFLIGSAPAAKNVIIAAGFCGHGFKFAPALAPEIAALALGRQPSIDLSRFRIDRPGRGLGRMPGPLAADGA